MASTMMMASSRFMYGLGLGLSLRCGPMYLRETVTGPLRNAATVSVKLSMVVGVIVSYILGGLLDNPTVGEGCGGHGAVGCEAPGAGFPV